MNTTRSNTVQAARDHNSLLSALSESDWDMVAPHLECRDFRREDAIFRQGDNVTSSTFPCGRMVVSLRVEGSDGIDCEVCTIGREGAIGGIVSHGHVPAFTSAIVETKGSALCIPSDRLEHLKQSSPAVRGLFARYADCLLAQVMQGAACNALHDVDKRIARWLLAFQDRYGGDVVPVTQEDLSAALGIGRPYASRQLRMLKQRGLVTLKRGAIEIRDRAEVERAACQCYGAVKSHFSTVIAGLYPKAGDVRPRRVAT
ncbi:MAG: Crp/Fnr family transcriptional regulator [Hyphomicrobiales bacterium]|nr:Crp/Fnr family transcriptional regulator [Hyphomicrobiales bacterium]